MKSTNSNTQLIAKGLISYLKKTGQLDQLAELTKIQQKKSWSLRTNTETTITSAVELSAAQKKSVEKIINHHFDPSAKIKYQVNKDVIGGLVIKVGNKIIDVSIKHRLEKLREAMLYV